MPILIQHFMMKKTFLYLVLAMMPVLASAQQVATAAPTAGAEAPSAIRFGYFSFEEVFRTMPGYAIAKHHMDDLRLKYDAETKRSEDEFNSKYEEFLMVSVISLLPSWKNDRRNFVN